MKKRYLALLMIVPFFLLCMSAFLYWSGTKLSMTDATTQENVQILKERALHADKETNPQARIDVLSKALIAIAAARDTMVNGYAQVTRGLSQALVGLAILQILFSAYVYRQVCLPNPSFKR
jgi:ABC-type uncharacterized transport system permease subunit